MKVCDESITEDGEFTSWKWFRHAVCPLLLGVNPNNFEGSVAPVAVISKKVVGDADVSGELGCRVIVSKVNGRLVVHVDGHGAFDELTWHALNDVDDPQENLDDLSKGHVFGDNHLLSHHS